MQHLDSGRPQIVAHRGASERLPEHTLAAYVAALDAGADALECDVRLTSDAHLVCVHDRTVKRTANTAGNVSAMTLRELDRLDFASWKNPWADLDDEAPAVDEEAKRVLTARRLLEVVADYDGRVDLAVESKHPTRYGPFVERRIADLLTEFGMHTKGSPVRVMSFSLAAMLRMKRLLPEVETVFLFDKEYQYHLTKSLPEKGWMVGPGLKLLKEQPKIGRKLRKHGRRIHVWTANTPHDWDLLCDLGAEALITDRPGAARDYLVGPDRRFPS